MNDHKKLTDYAEYISLGAEIAGGLIIPIFLGYWVDEYFQTSPWLLLIGCLIGMVNIFIIIFRLNKRLNQN